VSLISVEGLNFDSFLPLFGKGGIKIPVSVITDADPQKAIGPDGKTEAHYPAIGEVVTVSANTASMQALQDEFVKVFHGLKTFEYDLALIEENQSTMLAALADIHPEIAKDLKVAVDAQIDNRGMAETLFKGMFERKQNNVQKGKFAQALAAKIIDENQSIATPDYIVEAIKHACQT